MMRKGNRCTFSVCNSVSSRERRLLAISCLGTVEFPSGRLPRR